MLAPLPPRIYNSIPKISFKFCGIIPSRQKNCQHKTRHRSFQHSLYKHQQHPFFSPQIPMEFWKKTSTKITPNKKTISKWWTFNLGKHGGKIQWNSRRDCRAAAALASVKQVDSSVSTPQATSSSTWTRPRNIYRRNAGNFMKLQHEWRWMKMKESGWTLFTNQVIRFFSNPRQSLPVWDLAASDASWLVLGKWRDPNAFAPAQPKSTQRVLLSTWHTLPKTKMDTPNDGLEKVYNSV